VRGAPQSHRRLAGVRECQMCVRAAELKDLLDGSRLVNGKLSKTTISKAKKLLASA